MKIEIETIPHQAQRYPTPGDWFFTNLVGEGEILHIRVSKLSDWRREVLMAVHELIETVLCKHRGITQEQVDKFDMDFEKRRAAGILEEDAEPGDDPAAPYRKEHFFATNIEALLSAELGVDFSDYSREVQALP